MRPWHRRADFGRQLRASSSYSLLSPSPDSDWRTTRRIRRYRRHAHTVADKKCNANRWHSGADAFTRRYVATLAALGRLPTATFTEPHSGHEASARKKKQPHRLYATQVRGSAYRMHDVWRIGPLLLLVTVPRSTSHKTPLNCYNGASTR